MSVGGTRFPGRPEAFAGDAGGAVSVELVTARPGPPVSSCVLPYNVPSACWGRGGVPNSFNASLPTRTLGHLSSRPLRIRSCANIPLMQSDGLVTSLLVLSDGLVTSVGESNLQSGI